MTMYMLQLVSLLHAPNEYHSLKAVIPQNLGINVNSILSTFNKIILLLKNMLPGC